MAIKCIHASMNYMCGQMTADIRKRFVIDSEADVSSLPKCSAGSVAIVAAGGKVFMVNASGQWVEAGQATFSMAEEELF